MRARYLPGMRVACLAAFLVAACSDRCEGPLGSYAPPANLFSTAADDARARAPEVCTAGHYLEIGTCGTFSYITEGNALQGYTRFYDSGGAIVGAAEQSDNEGPEGCFERRTGTIPDCTRMATETLCP